MYSKSTRIIRCVLVASAIVIALATPTVSNAQCTILSSDNYSVTVKVTQVAAVLSKTVAAQCANNSGYTYQIKYGYTVTFGGTKAPALNTLQATFNCGENQGIFFSLPVNGGTGNNIISTSQASTLKSDCATANLNTLGCNQPITLEIGGKGINTTDPNGYSIQTLPCAIVSASITPLPVKLVSFDAEIVDNSVALIWTTATETDNAYFILERSADVQHWEALTKMDGAGTSRINATYNYTDDMPRTGDSYYRLRQVDANGSATYSRILAVAGTGKGNPVALYPNPNNGKELYFTGLSNPSDWSIRIVNTSSAVVYQSAGVQGQISLPVLPAGLYFVQLNNLKTGAAQTLKLLRN